MMNMNKPATGNRGGLNNRIYYTSNQPTHEEWLQDIQHMSLASLCEKYDVNEADALVWKQPEMGTPEWHEWYSFFRMLEAQGVTPHGYYVGDGVPRLLDGTPYEPFPEVPLAQDGKANR